MSEVLKRGRGLLARESKGGYMEYDEAESVIAALCDELEEAEKVIDAAENMDKWRSKEGLAERMYELGEALAQYREKRE